MKIITIKCPDCEHEIEYDPAADELLPFSVECENCGCEVLITSLEPLQYEPVDEDK